MGGRAVILWGIPRAGTIKMTIKCTHSSHNNRIIKAGVGHNGKRIANMLNISENI